MQIIQKKLADIVPYANNTKKHDETQIKNVAESIKKYGWVQPLVIDDDGTIVIGHCRALAAEKLGMEEVPCVVVSDLTEEEINALRIVDNKTNESPWDFDLLSAELPEIDLSDFEFDFDFGGENYSPDDFGEDFSLADGEKPEICQMTFTLHTRQKELIEYAIQQVKESVSETFGNTNANGNGLYEVVRQWAEQKK
jgi:hypothetical protein